MSSETFETLAVVQARLGSTRLPGKVLRDIGGRPALWQVMRRLEAARGVDGIVVAVPDGPEDDPLAAYVLEQGWLLHRGAGDDVLDRMYKAALPFSPRFVVRVTADALLLDPFLLGEVVRLAREHDLDYVSNCLRPTYPDGLDVEVVRLDSLTRVWREAASPADREHVTAWIRSRPGRFRCGNVAQARDCSSWCWALDNPEDLRFLRRVYALLRPEEPLDRHFRTVVDLLERHPDLALENPRSKRDEKLLQEIPDIFQAETGDYQTFRWEGGC